MVRTIAVLICVGGCSFAIGGPDPNRPATTAPTCDTSKGLVGLDTVTAVVSGVVGLAALSGHSDGVAGGALLTSALYGGSALRANAAVDHCRAAFRDYEVTMAGLAATRAPAIAAKPQDPYEAAAVAAQPPPAPKPAPAPKAEPEPAPQIATFKDDDDFHLSVGEPEPGRPAKLEPRPAKPASTDVWRDFWRGVP